MKIDLIEEQREARHYILSYLLENPDAGDTFDGIMEWWLLSQKIKFETRIVSEAVSKLIADNLIVEHRRADSRVIYKINRTGENIRNIRTMLSRTERG